MGAVQELHRHLETLTFAGDKQRMLSRNMEPASAVGSEIVSTRWNDIQLLHARVLGHGEDEAIGKRFMLLRAWAERLSFCHAAPIRRPPCEAGVEEE